MKGRVACCWGLAVFPSVTPHFTPAPCTPRCANQAALLAPSLNGLGKECHTARPCVYLQIKQVNFSLFSHHHLIHSLLYNPREAKHTNTSPSTPLSPLFASLP
ncbi:hypothetical protein E2C01_091434 [Portunus trituberculatus]|uniref:Secreted protein n=1 Tax=Portunus trituberculatus TaxID=210409 RepID=A0A5B7JJ19_PORTR|nr:hypothetical protein [Portunus trituberculatus]